MAVRVEETFSERDQTINAKGEVVEIEIPYFVFGADDEDKALEAARSKAASHEVEGMKLGRVEVVERINAETWKVKAVFEDETEDDPDDPEPEDTFVFSFDTSGGTMHRNQSIKTVSKTPNDAPDFNGAIEVDNEGNVNGTDVTMPVFNFTETHTLTGSVVTTSYKRTVASLTGTVNKSGFRGFDAGEVLFLGTSGTKRSKKQSAAWEITYRFAVSPNATGIDIGKLKVGSKRGWDYLWVRYAAKAAQEGKTVIRDPVAAYVEQVYPDGDFSALNIGS